MNPCAVFDRETLRRWLPGTGRKGHTGSWCFSGGTFPFYEMKRVAETNGGACALDHCAARLKVVKTVNCLCRTLSFTTMKSGNMRGSSVKVTQHSNDTNACPSTP